MFIKRVVLSNIKGFEQADLDFCPDGSPYPGWCVVTGDNGAGKTALLRAISLAVLGPDQSRGLLQDFRGWVAEGKDRGTISVEIKPDHDRDGTEKGGYPIKGTFWAEVEVTNEGATGTIGSANVFTKKRKGAHNGPWSQSTTGWATVAYGPFRRLYGTSPDAQRLAMLPGRIPRFTTLFKEDATLSEGEEWVRELNYKRLEQQANAGGAQQAGPLPADALSSLLDLVSDDFLRHGVSISDVTSEGIWLTDVAGRRILLEEMSEGYRSALAMLVDIFRHFVNIYGANVLQRDPDDDTHVYVDRPGVVLIDEVDVHLHPDWQRNIGYWLRRHFPLTQFIVTTHSPLVCPAADHGRIYHLPQPSYGRPFQLTEADYEDVIAGKPDEVLLTPAFGLRHTRSPGAVEGRRRHALLISKQLSLGALTTEEAAELQQLSLFARTSE